MSKFLKFIVHTVIILTIVCVAALAIPPFLGITTVVSEDKGKDTNLPLGSVTYAKSVNVKDIKIGDRLLVKESNSAYCYKVEDMDLTTDVFQVKDTTDKNGDVQSITLRNTANKWIITIGYIGYLLVATQSLEGIIIIGLAILFLVVLFVLAEVWRKDKYVEDEEIPEVEEESAVWKESDEKETLTKRELKKLEKQQKKENKAAAKAEKKRSKKESKKQSKSSGFVEDEEQPLEEEYEIHHQHIEDEAEKLLKKELSGMGGAITDVEQSPEEVTPEKTVEDMVEEETPVIETETVDTVEPEEKEPEVEIFEEEPESVELKKMAIPMPTVAELKEKAAVLGEDPIVREDEVSGVTTFDYSRIILDDGETEE